MFISSMKMLFLFIYLVYLIFAYLSVILALQFSLVLTSVFLSRHRLRCFPSLLPPPALFPSAPPPLPSNTFFSYLFSHTLIKFFLYSISSSVPAWPLALYLIFPPPSYFIPLSLPPSLLPALPFSLYSYLSRFLPYTVSFSHRNLPMALFQHETVRLNLTSNC